MNNNSKNNIKKQSTFQAESSQSSPFGGSDIDRDGGGRGLKVKCPASVSNLVCGFDIFGMALHKPFDIISAKLINEPKVIIRHVDNFNLPTDPEKNVAGV